MKIKIKKVNSALKDLHKRFLEQERTSAEQYFERRITPFEFLLMLTQDKNFVWMQPFSALIAEIDAFTDEAEIISNEDLVCIKNQIEFLLKDSSSNIVKRYNHHLSADAEFIMLHSKLKKELQESI